MRRPGGSEGPHRSFVTEEKRDDGSGGWGVWLRDIMGFTMLFLIGLYEMLEDLNLGFLRTGRCDTRTE